MVLPYEGMSNQIYGIVRGIELARILGRKLVIPPIIRSKHEPLTCPDTEQWSQYLDLSNLGNIIPLEEVNIGDRSSLPALPTYSFGRWKNWSVFGSTTHLFLHQTKLKFSLRWRPIRTPVNWQTLVEILTISDDPILVLAQLQHVHFSPSVNDIKLPFTMDFLKQSLKIDAPYYGVHWRRGDFKLACHNKKRECWPHPTDLHHHLHDQTIERAWLATDDPNALMEFSKIYPNLTFMESDAVGCAQRYFMDMAMLIASTIFIGNPYSTFSRLVISERRNVNHLNLQELKASLT
jgi:hypothetical protein